MGQLHCCKSNVDKNDQYETVVQKEDRKREDSKIPSLNHVFGMQSDQSSGPQSQQNGFKILINNNEERRESSKKQLFVSAHINKRRDLDTSTESESQQPPPSRKNMMTGKTAMMLQQNTGTQDFDNEKVMQSLDQEVRDDLNHLLFLQQQQQEREQHESQNNNNSSIQEIEGTFRDNKTVSEQSVRTKSHKKTLNSINTSMEQCRE